MAPPKKAPTKAELEEEERKKREEEEERLKREEEERKARAPKDFTNAEFVSQVMEIEVPEELSIALSKMLKIEDFAENLRNSITVDLHFGAITFAKEHAFSAEKLMALVYVLQRLLSRIVEGGLNMSPDALAQALRDVLLTPAMSKPEQKDEGNVASVAEGEAPAPAVAEGAAPVEEKKEEPWKPNLSGLFTSEDIRSITDFIVSTLFQHHKLYFSVYSQTQERKLKQANIYVQTALDSLPLSAAMTLADYEAMLAEKKAAEEAAEASRLEAVEKARLEAEEIAQKAEAERQRIAALPPSLDAKEVESLIAAMRGILSGDVDDKSKRLLERLASLESKVAVPK